MVNRLNSEGIEELLRIPDKKPATKAELEAAAKQLYFSALFRDSLMPSLKDTARACLTFYKTAAKASALYAQFEAGGYAFAFPAFARVTAEDVRSLARSLVLAGLVEPTDELLTDLDLTA